ncbi:hypothetical protein ACFSYG_17600 [Leeuwenhoekiella polynyae]|uniref:Lipocalin-like protein n=1 Tax=Leeuwenhoekiella polynyae TaxID=1550906 RepID=A0A4Q0P775_9FLAO|nr:hypothetical protein [Leeuwenhoekiella polynyae]RXG22301.1 hypothetical protein DSM02_1900 [Leeuwenhoekiella polynyae]
MKILGLNFFLGLTMAMAIQSCDNDDDGKGQENDITGQWHLYQRFDGDGIDPVDNGKTLTFTEENNFIDSFLPDCQGTFSMDNDTITIDMPCKDEPIQYVFSFEEMNLILVELPSTCDEGCYDIYKKK